ncbi:hypothetical protein FKM82_017558 [Ascaphus truei]
MGLNAASSGVSAHSSRFGIPASVAAGSIGERWGAGGACVTGWCGCECAPQNALCGVTLALPAPRLPLAGAVVGRRGEGAGRATAERLAPFGGWSFVAGGRAGGAPSRGVGSQSRV